MKVVDESWLLKVEVLEYKIEGLLEKTEVQDMQVQTTHMDEGIGYGAWGLAQESDDIVEGQDVLVHAIQGKVEETELKDVVVSFDDAVDVKKYNVDDEYGAGSLVQESDDSELEHEQEAMEACADSAEMVGLEDIWVERISQCTVSFWPKESATLLHFEGFPGVIEVRPAHGRGAIFVDFQDADQASAAMEELLGMQQAVAKEASKSRRSPRPRKPRTSWASRSSWSSW